MARAGKQVAAVAVVLGALATPALAHAGVTVFLNRDGATLTSDWADDSANNVASQAPAGGLVVPAWSGDARALARVARCVQGYYAGYAVDIVTSRPARGRYIMTMIGGTPDLLGFGDEVAGLSPSDDGLIEGAVNFVFAEVLDGDEEQVCLAAVHEVGHALGLDHTLDCRDPMSYQDGCGPKAFVAEEVACGEYDARTCGDGTRSQNSVEILRANVGLRAVVAAPAPEVAAPTPVDVAEAYADSETEPEVEPAAEPEADAGTYTGRHDGHRRRHGGRRDDGRRRDRAAPTATADELDLGAIVDQLIVEFGDVFDDATLRQLALELAAELQTWND